MLERYEFRIPEKLAVRYLSGVQGVTLGDSETDFKIRKIVVKKDSKSYSHVEKAARALYPEPLFYGWRIIRQYTPEEIENARLFTLEINRAMVPTGRECGAKYDDAEACPCCGGGSKLASELVLDLRNAPSRADFASTLAGEWIISQRLTEILIREKVTGFEAHSVMHIAKVEHDTIDFSRVPAGRELLAHANSLGLNDWQIGVWGNSSEMRELTRKAVEQYRKLLNKKSINWRSPPAWYHLRVRSKRLKIEDHTTFGKRPFDLDEKGDFRCIQAGKAEHSVGLNRLSELNVLFDSWDGSDFSCTSQLVGWRIGISVPRPIIVISQRLRRILDFHAIKGCEFEVARL